MSKQNKYRYFCIIITLTIHLLSCSTGEPNNTNKKIEMNQENKTIGDVLKTTEKKSTFLIRKNVPSISIRKGFDFADTYKPSTIQTLDDIEENMLIERIAPAKRGVLEVVTIEKYKLKFAKKFILTSSLPLNGEDMRHLEITKEELIETGHRRFIFDDNAILPFQIENIDEVESYIVLHPKDEKEQFFDLYQIDVEPNINSQRVYDYQGNYKRVTSSEFEFLYNDTGDFIGIKNLDKVEIE